MPDLLLRSRRLALVLERAGYREYAAPLTGLVQQAGVPLRVQGQAGAMRIEHDRRTGELRAVLGKEIVARESGIPGTERKQKRSRTDNNTPMRTFRAADELWGRVSRAAEEEGASESEVVRSALEVWLAARAG